MSMSAEQINLLLQNATENQNLEFKEAKTQFSSEKLFKYCVALANEGGGHLILGVCDKKPHRVVGTKAICNPSEMESIIFQNIGFRVDIEDMMHPDGRIVIVYIPSRPKGTAYHYKGTYLMRSGEQLRHMSEDRLRSIFAEGQPCWEMQSAIDNLSGQNIIELLDTQTYFELLNQPFPTNQGSILEKLIQERFVLDNRGSYSITKLGAILLARNLENFTEVSRKAVRVVKYSGKSKSTTILDQNRAKGYAVGFKSLVKFVMSQLPQNETIEDALRVETKMIPEIAIRELIANALIHQDLAITGSSVMIEIYENRIEISNPGEPIVPVERFIDGYQSRNEILADIMRRLSICEERSSGIDKVIEQAEIYQLPAPYFGAIHNRTIVKICGPKPFEKMTRQERIDACYQHCCLRYVTNQNMTNQSMRERFHLSDKKGASVSQVIANTIDEKLIKKDQTAGDSLKFRRYLPIWA